jgi:hypothetical protein
MLMHMLSAGGVPPVVDRDRAPDEDNPQGYYEFTPVKALNRPGGKEWLAHARGKAIKIISFLLPHLPDRFHYKVIFVKRRLPEVLASQKKMLARRGEAAGTSDEVMARLFADHLSKVEQLLASRDNFDVLYVEHRDTIEDPARVASAIETFLAAGLDTAAMAGVVDATLHRNRA